MIMGTGHRPDKLGGYTDAVNNALKALAITALQEHKDVVFVISGMALGWDMALAEAALELNLRLGCAVPFKGQELMWPAASQERYHHILSRATMVEFVSSPGYRADKMQRRNVWMLNNSTHIAALWNGTPGGTGNCLRYNTLFTKLPVINYWDRYKASHP